MEKSFTERSGDGLEQERHQLEEARGRVMALKDSIRARLMDSVSAAKALEQIHTSLNSLSASAVGGLEGAHIKKLATEASEKIHRLIQMLRAPGAPSSVIIIEHLGAIETMLELK